MNFKKLKKAVCILSLFALTGFAIPMTAFAADVDVYAEGAINNTELIVYVYADVNIDNLLSYGVRLNYDDSELAVIEAQKDPDPVPYTNNGTKWYIGESTASYKNNPAPDYLVAGEVVIIGGKLDPASPAQGIQQGARVFLGMVKFGPANTQIPENPNLSITYARGDGSSAYKNFVRLDNSTPQVLDGTDVSFGSVMVTMQGDANGDGVISPGDINAVKFNIGNLNGPCFIDCNGDGVINPGDINCVKSKI